MSTYTKDKNIYFLNDKNIAQSLDVVATSKVNPIPSLDLVNNLCATTNQISSNLVRDLSSYANDLSDALCATVNNRRKEDKSELSNVLSTYANSLCAQISTEISADRVSDKIELSNVLSSYTDSKIISLSSSLSNQINNEFVHISGDSITGSLAIDNALKVKNETYLYGKTYIYGNIIHGKDTKVLGIDRGIVFGVSAIVKNEDSFVWNGNNDTGDYSSHSQGTFNINPLEGSKGFYIGEQTLSDIIKDDVKLSSDNLTAQISSASAMISAWVDSDRKNDKSELSNVLSNYANSLCTQISIELSTDRVSDKIELSNALSSYANSLWKDLSDTISTGNFANYDTFEFRSLTSEHALCIILKDNYNHSKSLSVDTTDFIKNRVLYKVEVVKDATTEDKLVLRLWWSKEEYDHQGQHTDIPVQDLTKIYKEGDGIAISEDLTLSVKDNIARSADLINTNTTVNKLSTETIPQISVNVKSIQDYVNTLSDDSIEHKGIIWQLSDAITADVKNLKTLSEEIGVISGNLTSNVDILSGDVETIKAFDNMLSTNVNGTPTGIIPNLSAKLENIAQAIRTTANYAGKIQFNKYHPDFETIEGEKVYLSSIFEYFGYGTLTNPIKNGNIYEVIFDLPKDSVKNDPLSDYYTYDNPVFAADQYYDCIDFRLAHRDFIQIAINDSTITYIPLKDVAAYSKVLAGARFYEAAYDIKNTVWLSGGNNDTAEYLDHVIRFENKPKFVVLTGHCISGNNHFIDGNNIFDGYNLIEQLSTSALSAEKISAYQVSANNLSAYRSDIYDLSIGNNLSVANQLSVDKAATFASTVQIKNNITVDNTLTATVTNKRVDIANLSTGTLTVDWKEVKHPTGYSLFDLSTALSNKIWIDDQVDHVVNGTSDLSIVKIQKEDFDALVADEHSVMSGNTIYVVDSDYIDAYGQVIANLAMDKDDPSYMLGIAASKPYVDFVSSNISATVDQNRIADKSELSNVLSTYANSLCASISSTVDQNRIADKKELSNVLSTYTDTKIQKLSNILSSVSYAIKHDSILSNGITNDSDISTILSATVKIFNLLSSF